MRAPRTAAWALGVAACLAAALWPLAAEAYCFAAACEEQEQGALCDGGREPRDGCAPLWWQSGCVGYSVHSAGSSRVDARSAELITQLAFDAWLTPDCGGGPPGVVVQYLGQVECGRVEYNQDAGNANVVVFRDDGWPHPDTGHNIALTTTTYNPRTGELLDADIELNSASYQFSLSDDDVRFDLLAVLTHEVGHFLGLSHSDEVEATMYASYEPGTTSIRTLEPDDEAAICELYPPDPGLDESCNPLPRHGFSPHCRGEQPEGDCSIGRASSPPRGLHAVFASVAGAWLLRRRSRRRDAGALRARAARPLRR